MVCLDVISHESIDSMDADGRLQFIAGGFCLPFLFFYFPFFFFVFLTPVLIQSLHASIARQPARIHISESKSRSDDIVR